MKDYPRPCLHGDAVGLAASDTIGSSTHPPGLAPKHDSFEDAPAPPVQADRADLQLAFADLRSSDAKDEYLLLRLGRQEMSYGAGRLIVTRAAPNLPFKFDGVTARARSGASTVSALLVRPGKESTNDFDGQDDLSTFWGLYGESVLPRLPAVIVNAYYFLDAPIRGRNR